MKYGTKIICKKTKKLGVVIPDGFNCCGLNEVMIEWEGSSAGSAIDKTLIEFVENVDYEIENPKACGVGKGKECCIFITCSRHGFCCERFSSLRNTLIFKTMSAKRVPYQKFPDCQIFKEN